MSSLGLGVKNSNENMKSRETDRAERESSTLQTREGERDRSSDGGRGREGLPQRDGREQQRERERSQREKEGSSEMGEMRRDAAEMKREQQRGGERERDRCREVGQQGSEGERSG